MQRAVQTGEQTNGARTGSKVERAAHSVGAPLREEKVVRKGEEDGRSLFLDRVSLQINLGRLDGPLSLFHAVQIEDSVELEIRPVLLRDDDDLCSESTPECI